MTIQRTSGGIKYDTAVKEVSQKSTPMPTPTKSTGSGDAKIAAYKAATSNQSTGMTPKEYNDYAEQQKEAEQQTKTPEPLTGMAISPLMQQAAQSRVIQPSTPTKGLSSTVYTYPSPVSPAYIERANLGALAAGIQDNRTASELRRDIVQSQGTIAYIPGQKTDAEKLRELDQKEATQAMQLGKYESYAGAYESKVNDLLLPLTGSSSKSARFIGGAAESVLFTPVAVPRLAAGLATNPGATVRETILGTSEQIISDPARGTGQLVGMFLTGKAAGKVGSIIKQKTPAISASEQSFLVKTKVSDTAKPIIEQPKPITQAEFRGSGFGVDNFKISDIQSQVGATAKPQPTLDVLVGKSKGGVTDVYFKADKATAQALAEKYTGTVENIKTPQGSAVVFEPTGLKTTTSFTKTGSARIGTPERILIGEQSTPGASVSNPFRLEKRTNLQPAKLELAEPAKALSEFTRTIDAKGKVVNDFNIRDYYKTPDAAEFLQLESGLIKQKKSLISDTSGTLKPKVEFKRKPSFIGEMPEMQTRYVRFAEPVKAPLANPFKSDLQAILKRTGPETKSPFASKPRQQIAASVRRAVMPAGATVPLIIGIPRGSAFSQQRNEPFTGSRAVIRPSQNRETRDTPLIIPSTGKNTDTKTNTVTELISQPKPSTANPFAPTTGAAGQLKPPVPPVIKVGKSSAANNKNAIASGFKQKMTKNPFKEVV